jgi:hypothetical protein
MAARIARLHRRRGGVDSTPFCNAAGWPSAFRVPSKGKPNIPRGNCAERKGLPKWTTTLPPSQKTPAASPKTRGRPFPLSNTGLPTPSSRALPRPGGLVARLAACHLIAHREKRQPEDVAKQYFGGDRDLAHLVELRGAVTPAMTGVAGWAAELAATVVQDVADNLLPASVLAQLRSYGLAYAFIDGAVARVPVHTPTPSGGFVAEGGAIPVGALIIAALGLKPKKAASITAITKELVAGSPLNVEQSLRTLLGEDSAWPSTTCCCPMPPPHQPRRLDC